MTVMSKAGFPNRLAKSWNLRDVNSNGAHWKTEPIDEAHAPVSTGPRPLRVAIADDCRDGADTLAMVIRHWGYEAEVAYGGAEALILIKAYDPDVVFLDIAMPKVTGLEVAHHLRKLPRFKHTLLIALTGYADEFHRKLILSGGFDHFFAKPSEAHELKRVLSLCHQVRTRSAGAKAVG
jgi:CheY-like chemotaxis protein